MNRNTKALLQQKERLDQTNERLEQVKSELVSKAKGEEKKAEAGLWYVL